MNFVKKALLMWMTLWLPFAGAMAAVMPLTGAAVLVEATANASPDTVSPANSSFTSDDFAMPCHTKSSGSKLAFGQTCSHCVLCHLAGALALGAMPVMPQVPPTHVFAASPLFPHPSFVPDLPNPPPRASLA